MITLDQFITKWTGKGIDFDGVYGNQCMDVMHQYLVECLGLTDGSLLAQPDAKSVYLNFATTKGHELFDKIDNTPTGVPLKGDIIFWGTGIGQWGHVAMMVQGDIKSFRSFDQNWNGHSYCEVVNHPNYVGVLGWLRLKPQVPMATITQAELDAIRKARDDNYNNYIAEKGKTSTLTTQLSTCQTSLTTCNNKILQIKQICG